MSKFLIKLESGFSMTIPITCGICGENCCALGVWVHKTLGDEYACAYCATSHRNEMDYSKAVSISLVE